RRKKSKTSETTSGSASGGIDLNDDADEETEELRPMGRDRSKAKKKSAGSSRAGSSSFVDLVADKFLNMKQTKWGMRSEEKQSYIDLKNRELSIRETEVQQAAQLKRDKDILLSLPPLQQQKLLEMKLEIKARYNLDY
ncbi:hypothetical protein Tco_1033745, partial [Tanacetum coccineum]